MENINKEKPKSPEKANNNVKDQKYEQVD